MFTINRDNYETWLMLYLDNELSASERKAVEVFCTDNPDVQDELNGLKEVMLQPDLPGSMPGKERLLMPEMWNEEALTRQQQQLLMLADNELPKGDKILLENELETNPLLQKEWGMLQKTVLESAVPVEMPGKESLYRHERTRVFPIGRIFRIAAAAAILGFGWFFARELVNNSKADHISEELAVTVEPAVNPGQQSKSPITAKNSIDSLVEDKGIGLKEIAAVKIEKGQLQPIKNSRIGGEQTKSTEEAPKGIILTNHTAANQTDLNNRDIVSKIPSVSFVDVPSVEAIETPNITETVKVDMEPPTGSYDPQVMQAYEIVNADDIDADESISIAGARISKQKIRNVYRNITRPLARTFDKTPAPRSEIR
jgi:anti-sigma factor RsiW